MLFEAPAVRTLKNTSDFRDLLGYHTHLRLRQRN
jgi:hypothetical protein